MEAFTVRRGLGGRGGGGGGLYYHPNNSKAPSGY